MQEYEFHEIASLFPLMDKDRLAELAENIKAEGLHHSIILYEGKILDGRNRYNACKLAGIEPAFVNFNGGNPWEYVWSTNAERRDLTADQRYLIWKAKAEKSAAWEATRQAIREAANLKRSEAAETRPRTEDGTWLPSSRGTDSTATGGGHPSRQLKAEASNTNRGAVARGDYLYSRRPDLAKRVALGEITMPAAIREVKREEIIKKLESIQAREAKELDGVYDVIVIDPPWPLQKIERDERPNQSEFEYPTMTIEEIADLRVPVADDCHVWLWTTQKYIPAAFRLLEEWGLKYVCTFVWRKPGGFQPYGLPQFNCEFALYARRGSPHFIDTRAFSACFDAPRGGHSEKPELFYDTIRRVTAGRRLDMFGRRRIEGFDSWGKEA